MGVDIQADNHGLKPVLQQFHNVKQHVTSDKQKDQSLVPVVQIPTAVDFTLHDRALRTPEIVRWRNSVYTKFKYFSDHLRKTVERIECDCYQQARERGKPHETCGMFAANTWLRETVRRFYLLDGTLDIFSSDTAIRDWCNAKAKAFDTDISRLARESKLEAMTYIASQFERLELETPESVAKYLDGGDFADDQHKQQFWGDLGRMINHRWWLRKVRVIQARTLETMTREMGLVHKKAGKYVSDYSLRRRWQQKKRNREFLESLLATNEFGQSYTLQELSDRGVANPELRRKELMARIGGFERLSANTGLFIAMFYTITCPSKYHAYHVHGERNEKWVQAGMPSPRDAQNYLNGMWKEARSALHRAGVRWFGFAIAEPHHDGCPHWHMILWVQPDKKDDANSILEHYACREDREELSRDGIEDLSPRFKPVEIDESKGTATGYVVKYVSKNIDGHGIEADLFNGDAVEGAARIEAWASTWGIRQFRQIGGPSVTVWRELRRCRDEMILPHEEFQKIQQAANQGDWAAFTDLMGGPLVSRNDMKIRVHMVARVEKNDYDEIVISIFGIVYAGEVAITRTHKWTISFKRAQTQSNESAERAPPKAA